MADEKIFARGLYENLKDEIVSEQETIASIKKSIQKYANSDEIDTESLRKEADAYDEHSKIISQKWRELHDLKKIWGFK